MNMKIKIYMSFMVIFFVGASAFVAMRLSGFCIKKISFATEEMAVSAAVMHEMERYPPAITTEVIDEGGGNSVQRLMVPKSPIIYVDANDMIANNHGCCTIVRSDSEGARISFFNQIFDGHYRIVSLKYSVKYLDGDGKEASTIVERFFVVDCCGNIRKN